MKGLRNKNDANGDMRSEYKILVGKLEGKNHSEERGVNGKIILKWILGKQGGKVWTGCILFKILSSGGLISPRAPYKAGNFLTS
jgi:hypothetical protein